MAATVSFMPPLVLGRLFYHLPGNVWVLELLHKPDLLIQLQSSSGDTRKTFLEGLFTVEK